MIDLAATGKSARAIVLSLGVGKTQIQGILANKTLIIQSLEGRNEWHTVRKSKNSNLNQLVWDWFVKARSRNFVVTGPILQEKARELAKEMDFTTFKALNGWLESFKKRYGAKSSMLSGEAADVRDADVEDWKLRLPKLREGYSLDNCLSYHGCIDKE